MNTKEIKFRFVFHNASKRGSKNIILEYWNLEEILFGVGESKSPVQELIQNLKQNGYKLIFIDRFTGIKDDIAQEEIYERDIVQLWWIQKIDFVSLVYYKNGCFQIDRYAIKNNSWPLHGFTGKFEVIGNIHENYELLSNTANGE